MSICIQIPLLCREGTNWGPAAGSVSTGSAGLKSPGPRGRHFLSGVSMSCCFSRRRQLGQKTPWGIKRRGTSNRKCKRWRKELWHSFMGRRESMEVCICFLFSSWRGGCNLKQVWILEKQRETVMDAMKFKWGLEESQCGKGSAYASHLLFSQGQRNGNGGWKDPSCSLVGRLRHPILKAKVCLLHTTLCCEKMNDFNFLECTPLSKDKGALL